jgi:hypothetical protein
VTRRSRLSIAASGIAGALLTGAPCAAQDFAAGWVPVYEDYARGWGSNRPFWWSDLGPTPYWGGTSFDAGAGWPYNTWYGPASTYTYRVGPARAAALPVVTAQGAAAEGLGTHCTTPVKTCVLRQPFALGAGCSCKVAGGPAYGSVVP